MPDMVLSNLHVLTSILFTDNHGKTIYYYYTQFTDEKLEMEGRFVNLSNIIKLLKCGVGILKQVAGHRKLSY